MADTRTLRSDLEVAATLARMDNKANAAILYQRAADRVYALELALNRIAGHVNITADQAREIADKALVGKWPPKGDSE